MHQLHLLIRYAHLTHLPNCFSVFDVDIGDGEPIRKLPYNLAGELFTAFSIHFEVIYSSITIPFSFLKRKQDYSSI